MKPQGHYEETLQIFHYEETLRIFMQVFAVSLPC